MQFRRMGLPVKNPGQRNLFFVGTNRIICEQFPAITSQRRKRGPPGYSPGHDQIDFLAKEQWQPPQRFGQGKYYYKSTPTFPLSILNPWRARIKLVDLMHLIPKSNEQVERNDKCITFFGC